MKKFSIIITFAISTITFASEYSCNYLAGWPPTSTTSISKSFRTNDPALVVKLNGYSFHTKSAFLAGEDMLQLRIVDHQERESSTVVKDGYTHPFLSLRDGNKIPVQAQCWLK